MASTAILAIRIISDARKAAQDLQGLEGRTGRLARAQQKATGVAKGVVGGLAAVAVAAGKQASDLQQSSGAVESVFKRQAGAVKSLASRAAQDVGLARSEYQDLAATLGAQLGNLGVAQKRLVPTTNALIAKGADLAATFGGSTKEAVEALGSALRGETDPIERYGIGIKDATIKAELARKGQDKLTGSALTQARTQALLALVNKQSAAATGSFARESDTAAGAQQRATAAAKDAAANLGTVLLPVVAKAATALAKVAGWVSENQRTALLLIGVVGGLAVAVLAVNAAVSAWTAVMAVARAATIVYRNAQLALNLALMANPVGLIIVAVIALVAAIVVAYKKSERFRRVVKAVMAACGRFVGGLVDKVRELAGWVRDKASAAWTRLRQVAAAVIYNLPLFVLIRKVRDLIGWVRDKAPEAFRAFKDKAGGFIRALVSPITTLIGWVESLLDKIRSIKLPSFGGVGRAIGGLFGSRGGVSAGRSPSLHAAAGSPAVGRSMAGGYGGPPVVIQVNGALDPDAVARQIVGLLGTYARRFNTTPTALLARAAGKRG